MFNHAKMGNGDTPIIQRRESYWLHQTVCSCFVSRLRALKEETRDSCISNQQVSEISKNGKKKSNFFFGKEGDFVAK